MFAVMRTKFCQSLKQELVQMWRSVEFYVDNNSGDLSEAVSTCITQSYHMHVTLNQGGA
jgi:hypothetical protein